MSILGEKIKALRAEGKSFLAIARELNCSKGTIGFHLSSEQRRKTALRVKRRRLKAKEYVKQMHGGACAVCGYNSCFAALEFDHLIPQKKLFSVARSKGSIEATLKEAEKCILLCCRCHRERHAKLLDIGPYLEPDV